MQKLRTALKIFITFLKVSAFTVGGGFVALPLLKAEVVEKHKWISEDELLDIYIMSQFVPGLIYVSTTTFIGYRVLGIFGAVIANIAVLIPSAVAIMFLVLVFGNILESQIMQKILMGIVCGVVALTLIITINMIKKSINTKLTAIIFTVAFVLIQFLKVKVFYVVFTGFLFAIIYSTTKEALKLYEKETKND